MIIKIDDKNFKIEIEDVEGNTICLLEIVNYNFLKTYNLSYADRDEVLRLQLEEEFCDVFE